MGCYGQGLISVRWLLWEVSPRRPDAKAGWHITQGAGFEIACCESQKGNVGSLIYLAHRHQVPKFNIIELRDTLSNATLPGASVPLSMESRRAAYSGVSRAPVMA